MAHHVGLRSGEPHEFLAFEAAERLSRLARVRPSANHNCYVRWLDWERHEVRRFGVYLPSGSVPTSSLTLADLHLGISTRSDFLLLRVLGMATCRWDVWPLKRTALLAAPKDRITTHRLSACALATLGRQFIASDVRRYWLLSRLEERIVCRGAYTG